MKNPKVFVSYSWDDEEHKNWVANLARKLREDGVETILDRWHAVPGDQLPEFMEREIRTNDFVLIICTPKYKKKSDNRTGGVGYEGDIIAGEVFVKNNDRKFIPVLAKGTWQEAAPSSLLGKYYIDLSARVGRELRYADLLSTLLEDREQPPPVGPRKQKKHDDKAKLPTLIPIASESRIVTGDMVVLGGNYKENTPFGFEASFCLKAVDEDLDIIGVDCSLFRERKLTIFPDGKGFMDYTDDPQALEVLPTRTERDYARNSTPGPISGAFGIFGGGSSVSPMMVGDASILINCEEITLRKDWKTLSHPWRLAKNETVVVRYSRVCFPGKQDEVPADLIYQATIECKLEFVWSSESDITRASWIMDYSKGGTISLRQC
jgi:hypothetical protein